MSRPALDLEALRALALEAAAAGAAVHVAERGRGHVATAKGSPTDVVTEVDRAAERAIVDVILRARPEDGILAEEDARRDGTSGVRWVVDPLDGTTNYVYGWPAYGVSIGVEAGGRRVLGVVHDSALDQVYVGIPGQGSWRDGEPLRVRAPVPLAMALVATGFQPYPAHRAHQAAILERLLPQVRDIRRGGSAAIDLCAVAAGRLDAYFECALGPWDVSGGLAVAEAAGARIHVRDVAGARGPLVVAGPPAVADALLAALVDAGATAPWPPA